MKKALALVLALALGATMLASCGEKPASSAAPSVPASTPASKSEAAPAAKPVDLRVVTSYGGDDGNRVNYENAFKAYEKATGNTVVDESATSNEEWKARVMADFQTGSEPDVLFYFTGVDANEIVKNGKVVSLETIRKEYPEYAGNMKDGMLPASPADMKQYAIPVNGYWEGMFVNKNVLKACDLEVPTKDTTWEQFMTMCKTIKDKGYTPIACSLQEVPHYWFEFCVMNQGSTSKHVEVPASSTDAAGKRWVSGLDQIKAMYEAGCFPKNTLTAGDADTFQLMADDKAAFAIDGSWKVGWFAGSKDAEGKDVPGNVKNLDDYTVTYVPGMGERKSTDIVAGLSMGYYITQKAWDDPAKRDAAVKFVEAMTTDEVINTFAAGTPTALKAGMPAPKDANSMQLAAIEMVNNATGSAPAVQDSINPTARGVLWTSIKDIVTGKQETAKALDTALATEFVAEAKK
ncbi:MAG: extracellular solute-binding protein [Oscillospiraceae bacterium]